MYKELSTEHVAHELSSNPDNGFSYHGALALAEYLEQYEEDCGEKIELDTVALRCEYSEYGSAWDAMQEYQPEDMPTVDLEEWEEENGSAPDLEEVEEAQQAAALEWLEERTTVIPFDGRITLHNGEILGTAGVIIQQF